jgi:hypothetical protein
MLPLESTLLLAVLLALATPSAGAAVMGVHTGAEGEVRLHTEACRRGSGQRATREPRSGRATEGCWKVDRDTNPVVRWRDGRRQVLDGDQVRLAPAFAALLQPPPAAQEAAPGKAVPAGRRPGWCSRARWPHERLVCADPALAAADLALAPLWRRYQADLEPGTRAWVKRDYFQRLKACGAQRECVAREQASQRQLYLAALAQREKGASSPSTAPGLKAAPGSRSGSRSPSARAG